MRPPIQGPEIVHDFGALLFPETGIPNRVLTVIPNSVPTWFAPVVARLLPEASRETSTTDKFHRPANLLTGGNLRPKVWFIAGFY